jgi:protein TonB
MDIQQIPQADWLDILFEGRNKDYGAYDLRRRYNGRLGRAIVSTLGICILLFIGFRVAGRTHHAISRPAIPDDVVPVALTPDKKPQPVAIPKPLHVAPPAPTMRLVTTRIVPDDQVRPEDKPQPAVVPDNFRIAATTNPTATGENVTAPPSDGIGNGVATGVVNAPATPDNDDKIYTSVQIESSYEGGSGAWIRFLTKNFHVPELPDGENGGAVTINVRFVVDKEGNVSDIEAVGGPLDLQKEAVRVIRLSKRWKPAIQNGRVVNSYKTQPITVHWEN